MLTYRMRQLISKPIILAFCLLFCIACAPVVKQPGQAITHARLTQHYFLTQDQALLPVRSWLPENQPIKAVIIAVHGFNDYSNFFESPGQYLSQKGFASYAYDQRGFGDAPQRGFWAGIDAYRDDLNAFSQAIRKRHPNVPLYILGESMGGAVVISAASSQNLNFADGIILIAPAVWGRETMPWYQRYLLALSAYTLPWLELTGKGLHIMPSDNMEMLKKFSRDPKVIKATRVDAIKGLTDLMDEALDQASQLKLSTLILYGEKDQVIPKEPVKLMLEKVPQTAQTFFYPKGYHMLLRDLNADIPLSDIASWIEQDQTDKYRNATHAEIRPF